MRSYLACLKDARGMNADECRKLSMAYLKCRMDNNLMAPDQMKNLGFAKWAKDGEIGEETRTEEGEAKS